MKANTVIDNINIQSLSNKIDAVEFYLNDVQPDFMLVTEHWLSKAKVDQIKFKGYTVATDFCRQRHIHGGVLILKKSSYSTERLGFLDNYCVERDIEVVGIHFRDENMILIAVYRSPLGNWK
ncbi:hypothetical protein QE152_g38270 [Popillia japonica]|uniref:Uncharacterized protein n=1 Tax=Popillia japonica TaxID=7064 RepID=A0AAW1I7X9_POPJA